ncbi:MAG: hypothetical protein ACJ74Q_15035 [Pyrinomonadaceae bacterium]
MNTQKESADGAGGPGSLFAAAASAQEEQAPAEPEEEAVGAAEEDGTDLGGDAPAHDEEEDGDAAEVATAAAQIAVDAPAGGGSQPGAASASHSSVPFSPTSRILPDEDEPYVFADCTVNINIQLLPDDGDAEGREVIIAVSSHIEGPLVELTRLHLLGVLPPPVAELLSLHEQRLPALGEARAEQRQRESTAKTSGAKSKTTVRGANSKPAAASKPAASAGASGTSQSSLFDLNTGHRPKAAETPAAGGN